jgi:serine protease Do
MRACKPGMIACRAPLALAAMAVVALLAPPPAHAGDLPPDLAGRLAPLLPTVVNIETVTTKAHRPYYFWGSGFVVEPSGILVTNRHVIAGADRITVTGRDIPPLQAKILYVSGLLDLALLKIDAGKKLPVLMLGDSDTLRIGDPVLALGNPLGIGLSVSAGIVSALDRNIRETAYDDFIQTDAAINHGNSGGPMVDLDGKVVGIDTALYSSPHNTGSIGLGFAMPANDARFIIEQVIRTGHVQAGWAGLHVQRVTAPLASGFGLPAPRGVLVTAVDPGGPAASVLRPGDIILRLGDAAVNDTRDVQRGIVEAPVGQTLALALLRDGQEQTVSIVVAADPNATALPESMQPPPLRVTAATPADPGFRLAALTTAERRRFEVPADAAGVVVTEVPAGSAAAEQGLVAGDVIMRVRTQAVHAPADVTRALAAVAATGADHAPLLIRGRKDSHWVALPLAADR